MALTTRRTRFSGTKLVVSIDVGTTFTAASYCMFDDMGEPLKLQEINRWPGQVTADAKIPSVLYYDKENMVKLHGAETEDEQGLDDAQKFDWRIAEWFKLNLRPDHLLLPEGFSTRPLPLDLTVDDIYCNHFEKIIDTVDKFIIRAHGLDNDALVDLKSAMYLILATPNGWDGRQQDRIRRAAVKARLVPSGAELRIRFVSEGEAALHYALDNIYVGHSSKLQNDSVVLVCDAGGGTTDIAVYRIKSMKPVVVDELCSPTCYVTGGTFVTEAARRFIARQLAGTPWNQASYIADAVKEFEKNAKRRFKGTEDLVFLKLDSSNQSLEKKGIIRGKLRVSRDNMVSFFDPFIDLIIGGLNTSIASSTQWGVDHVVLVGGFAESDYVFSKLRNWADNNHLSIGKPDDVLSKAIAHGALSWHMHSAVRVRVAKYHYGAESAILYDPDDPNMIGRARFQNILGETMVRYAWSPVVPKGERLGLSNHAYAKAFHREFEETDKLSTEMDIFAYRWDKPPPFFKTYDDRLVDGFIQLGTVKADLTKCFKSVNYEISPIGKRYKRLDYDICLNLNEVEMQARLRWKIKGHYYYGEAVIAYDV